MQNITKKQSHILINFSTKQHGFNHRNKKKGQRGQIYSQCFQKLK